MTTFIVVYLVGAVLSWVLTTGWYYAYFQSEFLPIADEQRESDSCRAIAWGICNGMLSWVGILLTYWLSERAKYGWRLPFSKSNP